MEGDEEEGVFVVAAGFGGGGFVEEGLTEEEVGICFGGAVDAAATALGAFLTAERGSGAFGVAAAVPLSFLFRKSKDRKGAVAAVELSSLEEVGEDCLEVAASTISGDNRATARARKAAAAAEQAR